MIRFLLASFIFMGFATLVSPLSTLKCRLCNQARTLADCNSLVTCDATLEKCFMDEIITDQLTVVYNGGCRAKSVCDVSGGKRSNLLACSRCCAFEEDCNKRLCGIKDDTLNNTQCYSCDHRSSEQSEVKDSESCVTLDTCNVNEGCYSTQSDIGGKDEFFYGCLNLLQCHFLMKTAYEDYKNCVSNKTALPPGPQRDAFCGRIRRATSLCHSCCADGGCNYGTCEEMNARIFHLAEVGKFDMNTLKMI